MSSSKSNKKWKDKVLEDFLKRSKFTEGSIYKFQDQITVANNPNDVPLHRERVFEKTVYRISKIDKEDCKPIQKKEVKPKNLEASPDQCELIAEIDKNLKHLKDQKRFLQMARQSKKTWGEHLSANLYAKEKACCNRRTSPEHCHLECGSSHVCDVLQKLINKNHVKVADSCTQIESPIWDKRCDSGGDYSSWQYANDGYPTQCAYNEFGHTCDCRCDCSSAEAEWKARMNNCNFRPCPTKKVKPRTQAPPCCVKCPKSQCSTKKRVSVCSPLSQGSSPRFIISPPECPDFVSGPKPGGKLRAGKRKDYCSDDSRGVFETTYMASYRPQTDQNYATRNFNGKSQAERELKTKIIYTKPKNTYVCPKPLSPRTPRTPTIDSVERDLRRMPYRPVKLSEEIEQRWVTHQKNPQSRAFNQQSPCKNVQSYCRVSPRSPRKVGTTCQVSQQTTRRPRQRTMTGEPKNLRSRSQVSASPRKVGTSCQISQSRVIDSARSRQSPRQQPITSKPKSMRSYSQVCPRSPTPPEISQTRVFETRYKQSPRQRTRAPERSPSTQRKVETPRHVSRTTGLDSTRYEQSPRQRAKTPEPKNAQSERNLYSKTVKSRQVIRSKPFDSSRTKQSPTQTYEIYEKRTKVEQSSYRRRKPYRETPPQSYDALDHGKEQRPHKQSPQQSYEVLNHEKKQKHYRQSPQESYEVLEPDNVEILISQQAYKTRSRSPTNDLSEASSSTPLRKYQIIKPNVIDDNTYTYPGDDETEDYVILPYSPMPKDEEQLSGRPLDECDDFTKLEPTTYQPEYQDKLSESVIKKSEVILEDASNASIAQMRDRSFKPEPSQQFEIQETCTKSGSEACRQLNDSIIPQSHQMKEIYYISESSCGPASQCETKEIFYKSESNREPQLNDSTSPQVHEMPCKSEPSREPQQIVDSMTPQCEANEEFCKPESNRELRDTHCKSESSCDAQKINIPVESKDVFYKSESDREPERKEPMSPQPYPFDVKDTQIKKETRPPEAYQHEVKVKSGPSSELQLKSSPSSRSYKSEKKDSPLKPKPFHSETNYSTSFIKEDKPIKSDQELKSYSQMSKEMSKRFQSSKINSNEGSVCSVPPKMEDKTSVKSEAESHTSETSQEFLSETQNQYEPVKGIDSDLQKFILYLQNRLRDCDEMVRKQLAKLDEERKECQKKNVCPKLDQLSICDSDRSGEQSSGVCQNFKACKPDFQLIDKTHSGPKQKDISCHSSIKSGTEADDESCLNIKEIGELTLPLDSDQITESELEFDDECHCYRCEEYKLAPICTEIPPFTGCDCMKEDYYKIMQVVYNK